VTFFWTQVEKFADSENVILFVSNAKRNCEIVVRNLFFCTIAV